MGQAPSNRPPEDTSDFSNKLKKNMGSGMCFETIAVRQQELCLLHVDLSCVRHYLARSSLVLDP